LKQTSWNLVLIIYLFVEINMLMLGGVRRFERTELVQMVTSTERSKRARRGYKTWTDKRAWESDSEHLSPTHPAEVQSGGQRFQRETESGERREHGMDGGLRGLPARRDDDDESTTRAAGNARLAPLRVEQLREHPRECRVEQLLPRGGRVLRPRRAAADDVRGEVEQLAALLRR
jgi:hypothetical protein